MSISHAAAAQFCPNPLAALVSESVEESALPWHMLAVGGLTLIWYALGFAEFGLTGTASHGFSGWTQASLAGCLWGGFAGAVLLLFRSRLAVQALVVALVGVMATSLDLFVLTAEPGNLYAMPTLLGLWLITQVSLFYALRVRSLGLLR